MQKATDGFRPSVSSGRDLEPCFRDGSRISGAHQSRRRLGLRPGRGFVERACVGARRTRSRGEADPGPSVGQGYRCLCARVGRLGDSGESSSRHMRRRLVARAVDRAARQYGSKSGHQKSPLGCIPMESAAAGLNATCGMGVYLHVGRLSSCELLFC